MSIFKHTHMFNGPFLGTTQVSRYQKGKTNLDFTEAIQYQLTWVVPEKGPLNVCECVAIYKLPTDTLRQHENNHCNASSSLTQYKRLGGLAGVGRVFPTVIGASDWLPQQHVQPLFLHLQLSLLSCSLIRIVSVVQRATREVKANVTLID